MTIRTAEFVKSAPALKQCPKDDKPEYAFIGRSNVGKSSLINMLVNRKSLAKTSSTPGKTQLINYFIINDKWFLVDLPGMGYAKVSKSKRNIWSENITEYLLDRQNLLCTFLLIDSRLEPQKIDIEFMEWMAESALPFVLVFTKTDKLTPTQQRTHIKAYKEFLLRTWEELPPVFITSAEKKIGSEDILKFIANTNKIFTM